MKNQSYENGKKLYVVLLVFVVVGLMAAILYHVLNLRVEGSQPTCFVNDFMHIYCPGCGGSRAIDWLLHGHILKSAAANPIVIYSLFLFLYYFIPATYTYAIKRDGNKHHKFHMWTLYGLLVVVVGFFIIRNVLLVAFHYDYLGDCLDYWI